MPTTIPATNSTPTVLAILLFVFSTSLVIIVLILFDYLDVDEFGWVEVA
jgi:hypothetical protein